MAACRLMSFGASPLGRLPFGESTIAANPSFDFPRSEFRANRVCVQSRRQLGNIRNGREWAEPTAAHQARGAGPIPAVVPQRRTDRIRLTGQPEVGTVGDGFQRDPPRQLSAPIVAESARGWSRDSKRIAFTAVADENLDVYSVDVESTRVTD